MVAVDLARDGAHLPVRAAEVLRAALVRQGIPVLDTEATRDAFEARRQRSGTDMHAYRRRFQEADESLNAQDPEPSLAVLEALITDLAVDPEFSVEKQALLEQARMKLALRLIGLAGRGETGKAETVFGRRARTLLVDALRTNPALDPSRSEYPPRFFNAVEAARVELAALGTGGLRVESRPLGADVYIEGRRFGPTPLALGDALLPRGTYRVWVEAEGVRSLPKLVRIGEKTRTVVVDLAFEGALWTAGPGLQPMAGAPVDEAMVRTLGELLQVEQVVLVGRWQYQERGDWLWGALVSVADGHLTRHGVLHVEEHPRLEAGVEALAALLAGEAQRDVEERPLPPAVLPGQVPAPRAASTPADRELPWVPMGIAAGSVIAAALAVGAVIVLIAAAPR